MAARGADSWLIAWEDDRAGEFDSPWAPRFDIYAQRLDDEGAPLSDVPIPIASTDRGESSPSIAGSPSGWLVTWTEASEPVPTLLAARVSLSGEVLDDNPIELGHTVSRATVAFDGTHWVVGWVDSSNWTTGTTTIVRLDADGAILDSPAIEVSDTDSARIGSVDINVDSVGYAVAWLPESDGMVVRHLNFAGAPVDSTAYIVDSGVMVYDRKLVQQNGQGWLFWHGGAGLNFQALGSDLPNQVFDASSDFDLVGMGTQALAAWYTNDVLQLGVAPSGGALEAQAELKVSFEQLHLAKGSDTKALLVAGTKEGNPDPSRRIYARVLDVVSDPTGGAGGDSSGGAGEGAGGSFAGGGGADSAGKGGEDTSEGGSPVGEAGGLASGGSSSQGGTSAGSGGTKAKGDEDRYVACGCRTGNHMTSSAPYLAVITAWGVYFRRRRRFVPRQPS